MQEFGGQLAWATRFDKNEWTQNQRQGQKHLDNCLKAGPTRIIALKLAILIGQLSLRSNRIGSARDYEFPAPSDHNSNTSRPIKGFSISSPKWMQFLPSSFHFLALSTRSWFIPGELLSTTWQRQLRFKYKNSWLKFIHFHNWIVWLGNC